MVQWSALERDIRRTYTNTRKDVRYDHMEFTYETLDMLDRYTTKDGTINRRQISSLFDRLDSLSAQRGNKIYDKTEEGMISSAEITAAFLLLNIGLIKRKAALDVRKEVALNKWIGDINLRDRTVLLAGQFSDDIRNLVRRGVYHETPVADIRNQIRDYYKGEEWKLDRIVESEIYNTHRLQFGKTVEDSGIEYVQFNEFFPESKNRVNHECYTYAREDNYGLGEGIFKVTDDKIYSPHPRCTGYLTIPDFVLRGEVDVDG